MHLGLVATGQLADSGLSAVDDLGWHPAAALAWQRDGVAGLAVRVAGPFLTAPGGYPVGRDWAPPGVAIEIESAATAAAVVADLAWAGVRMIKIALHTALPLLDDDTLRALVITAHEHGLPVVVHAEGLGQSSRALAAGADALAHTPWTERLSDDLVIALADRMTIISTLAIHPPGSAARVVATDNLARFHRAGGRVRYGTDMGNGPTPVGVNRSELAALVAAGLDGPAILETICRADGPPSWTPTAPPHDVAELPDWLVGVRRLPVVEEER